MVRLSLLLVGGAAAANLLRGTARRNPDDVLNRDSSEQEKVQAPTMKENVVENASKDFQETKKAQISQLDSLDAAKDPMEKMATFPEVLEKAQACSAECTEGNVECQLKCVQETLPGFSDTQKKQADEMIAKFHQAMKHAKEVAEKCSSESKIVCLEDETECLMSKETEKFQCMLEGAGSLIEHEVSPADKEKVTEMFQAMQTNLLTAKKHADEVAAKCRSKSQIVCSEGETECLVSKEKEEFECMLEDIRDKEDGSLTTLLDQVDGMMAKKAIKPIEK